MSGPATFITRNHYENHKVSVSGPFNVQHIPKVKNINDINKHSSCEDSKVVGGGTDSTKSNSNKNSVIFADKNSILVCTYPFAAEFDNELSIMPGNVVKLLSPIITQGWLMVQSINNGRSGWVPKDNVKILDIFNNISASETDADTDDDIHNESDSISDSSAFSNSLATTISSSNSAHSPINSFPIDSIFVHSMHSSNSSSNFWYRIDIKRSFPRVSNIHICRYYKDFYALQKKLKLNCLRNNNYKLPKLPRAISLDHSLESSLNETIKNLNIYLNNLISFLKTQSLNSLNIIDFLDWCAMKDTDFEHFVDLDDDQILKILKPSHSVASTPISSPSMSLGAKFNNDNNNIINNNNNNSINNNYNSIHNSYNSINNSYNSYDGYTYSNNNQLYNNSKVVSNSPAIRISPKILYKINYENEFFVLKLSSDSNFNDLLTAITEKLRLFKGFIIAYKDSNNVLTLLRDDNGLRKAINIDGRKVTLKIC